MQENMVVTGGKESRTYGILLNTGQISYECSMNECTNFQVTLIADLCFRFPRGEKAKFDLLKYLKVGGMMPLFLFILIFLLYIHSFHHLHTVHYSVDIRRGFSPSSHRWSA
jgi:hypothetical protein